MAAPDITIANGGNSISVCPPLWEYETTIKLPLWYSVTNTGYLKVFDAGTAYDRRLLKCTFLMDATDTGSFIDFFRDGAKGRGNNFTLTLSSSSGFFPFGPDKGDTGEFTCRMINMQPSPQIKTHSGWFEIDCIILMVSAPAYALPSVTEYGDLTIGNVTEFRYPQTGFKTKYKYAINNSVMYDATAEEIDLGPASDQWTADFDLQTTQSGAASLINYLMTTPRNTTDKTYDTFNITTRASDYIFGQENDAQDTYAVRLLKNKIVNIHKQHNIHIVKLSLQKDG